MNAMMPIHSSHQQRGIVLIITLLVLTAMVLASLAMLRLTDTSTLATRSYTFRSAGNAFTVPPIEDSVKWLTNQFASQSGRDLLAGSGSASGYSAVYLNDDNEMGIPKSLLGDIPANTREFPEIGSSDVAKAAQSKAYVLIERLCNEKGEPEQIIGSCVGPEPSPGPASNQGMVNQSQAIANTNLKGAVKVAYRITVRVDSPGQAISFGQAIINL